jgi:hypothetical protein
MDSIAEPFHHSTDEQAANKLWVAATLLAEEGHLTKYGAPAWGDQHDYVIGELIDQLSQQFTLTSEEAESWLDQAQLVAAEILRLREDLNQPKPSFISKVLGKIGIKGATKHDR